MKAFLLAAGLGTRLRPLTDDTPKCLVPIGGRPLLHYWLSLLERHGVNEVLINVHHLSGKVQQYLDTQPVNLRIQTFHEAKLLGSAGTVWANRNWVEHEEEFLIAYADNLTNADIGALTRFHREERPVLTVGLFRSDHPSECGIAEMDDNRTIVHFVEKPPNPRGNLANAGIYVAAPTIFDLFGRSIPTDIGFDVLPKLIGRMRGFVLQDYLLDVGTHEKYSQAQRDVARLNIGNTC